jgi:hypothetical protein
MRISLAGGVWNKLVQFEHETAVGRGMLDNVVAGKANSVTLDARTVRCYFSSEAGSVPGIMVEHTCCVSCRISQHVALLPADL